MESLLKISFTRSPKIVLRITRYILYLSFSFVSFTTVAQHTRLLDFGMISGHSPNGSLISDGTFLYGLTSGGGINNYGTIFKIQFDGTGYSNLLDFNGTGNGSYPQGSLFYDGTFLYGMTSLGGANNSGTIFKLMPDGSGFTTLFHFSGSDGDRPNGSLISDGTFLYGMTSGGGFDDGVIFKIMPDGTGYVILSRFESPGAGSQPYGDLLITGGFLYGMTVQGGAFGLGTIFKLMPDGTGYTTVFDFGATTNDGRQPHGSLIWDGTFLYGMTRSGGGLSDGIAFKIKPDGSEFTEIHKFMGVDIFDGSSPYGSFIFNNNYLYGLTSYGGQFNRGMMFKMRTDGTEYTHLFYFDGSANGETPKGNLLQFGTALYGLTYAGGQNADEGGTLFRFDLNACPGASITATSNELTASSGDSYQWFYNDIAIPDAINQSIIYNVLEYGVYNVAITTNGCTATSPDFIYLITENEEPFNQQFHAYPNPFSNNLSVNWESNETAELWLTDLLGRKSSYQQLQNGINELNTHGLPSGLYIVTIRTGSKTYSIKKVKR